MTKKDIPSAAGRQGWPWQREEGFEERPAAPPLPISVVVVADEDPALERTLRSILWQLPKESELLLVTESASCLPSSIMRYSDFFKSVYTEGPLGSKLNEALRQSRRHWFTWLKPGEMWMPSALAALAPLAEASVDLVSGRCLVTPCVGDSAHPAAPDRSSVDGVDMLLDATVGWPPAAFFRREMLLAHNGFCASAEFTVPLEWHARSLAHRIVWKGSSAVVAKAFFPARLSPASQGAALAEISALQVIATAQRSALAAVWGDTFGKSEKERHAA